MERSLRSVLVAEAYGTFLLTFVGTMTVTVASSTAYFGAGQFLGLGFIALAFGLALLSGIVTVGGVSGAHFNPAVTIGLAYSKRFPWNRVAPYIVAQLVGASLAAFAQLAMVGVNVAKITGLGNTLPNMNLPFFDFAALLAEIIGTMVLVITILGATDEGAPNWAPLGIALTLAGIILALGNVSGASVNPARTFGPSLVSLVFNTASFNYYWIYVVGPVLGALLASELYRTIRGR